MTDSRQSARGSRTDGASGSLAFASTVMALGSPWPSRSLHRVDSSAFSGSRVPCPRVLLSRARRSRLTPVSSTSSSCRPDCWPDPTDCSGGLFQVLLARRSPRLPAARVLLDRRTMSHSSFQRSPLHCLESRGVHVPRARRRDRFGDRSPTRLVRRLRGSTTLAACSSPTRPGCCTGLPVMGFVMFHRRDSEFPPRLPTLRSFSPCVQQTGVGSLLHAVGLRHPSRSPWSVHREPCLLVLGRRLLPARRCLHTVVTKPDTLPEPRGLSPSAEPWSHPPLPTCKTRCSLGFA
jgi:hypothetical protein